MTPAPCSIFALSILLCPLSAVAETQPLSDGDFDSHHAMLKPQPGESRWMEIPWYPTVWEGRKLAAKEGKPLYLMAGSGGAPCAGC